jgi:N-acetyl-gamma-glutamylphosphate reductase
VLDNLLKGAATQCLQVESCTYSLILSSACVLSIVC